MRRNHRGGIPWFGAALLSLAVVLGAITSFAPHTFEALHRHLALDWPSLAHFELYRLVTSPLVQSRAGYTVGIFALLLVVPVLELRIGTVRAALMFFLGDLFSTLPVLLALEIAAQLGNASAQRLASSPDSGSSSGAFACLAVLLCLLPPRMSLAGWAGLGGYFLVRFSGWHAMSDFQHALAVIAGVVLILWWPPARIRCSRAGRQLQPLRTAG